MTVKTVAIIMILLYNVRVCQSRRYDNFTLYSIIPTALEQLKFLESLHTNKTIDVVFWKKPTKLFKDVHLIVTPSLRHKAYFIESSKYYNLKSNVMLRDVGKAFDEQLIDKYTRYKTGNYSWNYYHSLEDIYQWLTDMSTQHPNVTMTSIGKSAEGRPIYVISPRKISYKKLVIVEGGIHGNEWISVEFVTYLLNELVNQNDTRHSTLHVLARKYDWCLIPVVNPDGYVYSQTQDRLWRKNRRQTGGGTGVDLNRNFDYSFGKYDTSNDSKHDYYCGARPFSEPESRALAEFIITMKPNLRFYFAFHGYGQKLIIPFGDKVHHTHNYNEMENLGRQAIKDMNKIYGVNYCVGTHYDTMGYFISGNSASWVKKYFRLRNVFTFQLRDNGSYGHALPSAQIIPSSDETLFGITKLITAEYQSPGDRLGAGWNGAQELRVFVFMSLCTFLIILLF